MKIDFEKKDTLSLGEGVEISRSDLQKIARDYHIVRLHLFGSAARAELGPESDIDLLVEFETGQTPSMVGMLEIKSAFEKIFKGRKVDIATTAIFNNPYRKQAIVRDMQELYAA